jgi:hypothetical protein
MQVTMQGAEAHETAWYQLPLPFGTADLGRDSRAGLQRVLVHREQTREPDRPGSLEHPQQLQLFRDPDGVGAGRTE